jgi:hypothetical protein
MSKYRKRVVVPEDTTVNARLNRAALVTGKFGRQVEVDAVVVDGEYKGTELHDWFSFSTDKNTGEEYISYGGRLFLLLQLVEPDLDDKLLDAGTDADVDVVIIECIKKLQGFEVNSRLTVAKPDDPDKRRNKFDAATMGPAEIPSAPF